MLEAGGVDALDVEGEGDASVDSLSCSFAAASNTDPSLEKVHGLLRAKYKNEYMLVYHDRNPHLFITFALE